MKYLCNLNKMDVSNNYSGRIIGSDNSSKSDSSLATVVKNSVSNGNLKRIRTYTSKTSGKNVRKLYGVYTEYVGYFVKTTSGGLK